MALSVSHMHAEEGERERGGGARREVKGSALDTGHAM